MNFTLLTVFFLFSAASCFEFRGAVNLLNRFKRQVVTTPPEGSVQSTTTSQGTTPSAFDSLFCGSNCENALQKILDEYYPNGKVNKDFLASVLFVGDNMEAICGGYEEFDTCRNKCPGEKVDGEASLDYVCLEHVEEFDNYMNCWPEANKTATTTCSIQCLSKAANVLQLDAKMQAILSSEVPDFQGLMDVMGEACDFMSCMADCAQPIFVEKCDEKAGMLLRGYMVAEIANAQDQFDSIGLGSLFPQVCRELIDPTLKPAPSATTGTGSDLTKLQTDVLTKELEVLNKESQKLDLEIEKLTLEKQVLQKQLE